jgi:hypothetical protein
MNLVEQRTAGPSEPEMEHYLRQAGWVQAKYYPQNWSPSEERWYHVKRLRAAVQEQIQIDRDTITVLQERLKIVES